MDDASERLIEEDMLDQFNYFDDEDEELDDRREPASLDSFDLVDEEPGEDEGVPEKTSSASHRPFALENSDAPWRPCRRAPYEN